MPSHIDTYGTVKLDENGRISRELPCTQCGYELRGVDPDGYCPECGASIGESLGHSTSKLSRIPLIYILILTTMSIVVFVADALGVNLYDRFDAFALVTFITFAISICAFVTLIRQRTVFAVLAFIVCVGLSFFLLFTARIS